MKIVIAAALVVCATVAFAQSSSEAIARYRAMLADGNPAELWETKGEALWKEPRGPKKASLQRCDLGQGAGVVKGAFTQMPRFFADTGRVQDLESRLLTCMQELQGFDAAEIAKTPFGTGEQVPLESLVAWIAGESRGLKFSLPQAHPKERDMYEAGRRVFYFRSGPYDFSCASCHGQEGKRIRMQELPNLTTQTGAAAAFGAWPAYRVSNGELWSLQRRMADCFRQQRFPYPGFTSDATIALGAYLGVTARGGESIAPSLAR